MPRSALLVFSFFYCMLNSCAALSEESFSTAFANYQKAEALGDTSSAVKYANLSFEMGVKEFGSNSENAVALKHIVASAYMSNNQPEEAQSSFDHVMNVYEKLHGVFSEQVHGILLEKLKVAELQRGPKFKEIKPYYLDLMNKTINVSKKLSEEFPEFKHVYYYRLAKVLNLPPLKFVFAARNFEIHKLAEGYLTEALGTVDEKVIEMQFEMAQNLYYRKQVTDSIKYYEKVINAFDMEAISSHPWLIQAHIAIVQISELRENSEAATKHALAIGKMLAKDSNSPEILFRIEPKYPIETAKQGKQGETLLSFIVDSQGFVKDIEIEESSHRLFSKASIAALKKWRYAPIYENGAATNSSRLTTKLTFRLDSGSARTIKRRMPGTIILNATAEECRRAANCKMID